MNVLRPTRFQSGGSPLGNTYTIVFSGFSRVVDESYLDMVVELFSQFNVAPVEAIAEFGDQKSIGSFTRVRKRIGTFFRDSMSTKSSSLNIEIGGSERRKEDTFYYDSGAASLSTGPRLGPTAWFGVDEAKGGLRNEFVDLVATKLLHYLGPSYGYFLEYPKHFWAGCYIASVISIPPGLNVMTFSEYGARVTRWRDRKWHLGLRESQGYLREVYHINFLLDAHLQVALAGKPFREIAERLGDLHPFAQCPGVYKWTVPMENLELARDELETSGLILSSPTEPISLPR